MSPGRSTPKVQPVKVQPVKPQPAKTQPVKTRPLRAVPFQAWPPGGSSTVVGGAPAQERTLRSQGKKTLRKLLEAAIVVFDKRGYHAARVDDIVRVAKTSHGTFYLYFSSKEDLFRALLSDVSQEMTALSQSLPSIGPNKAGYLALREWLDRFYELYLHYHPVIRAWMEQEVGNLDLGRIGAGVLGTFTATLVDRVSEIDPPPVDDPETAALAMVAMVERFSYYSVIQVVPLDRDVMLDTVATILHIGLFGGARRRR
jgi:AcrR family transcriptional regulator